MQTLLEVQELSRSFGGLRALGGVSFTVREGQIKSVIGPNGAGKTTLFNVISGVLRPDAGRIHFNGRRTDGLLPWQVSRLGMARTFQNLSLFDHMTVLENVMVARHGRTRAGFISSVLRLPAQRREEREIREAAMSHLSSVGLFNKAELPVSELSFGQRRQVELARALATDPTLLLLDEPASGLNPRETEELGRLIRRIRDSGISILLIEHDMSLVMELSDEIFVMHYGQPVTEGTPADVRAHPDVISIYLGGGTAHAAS